MKKKSLESEACSASLLVYIVAPGAVSVNDSMPNGSCSMSQCFCCFCNLWNKNIRCHPEPVCSSLSPQVMTPGLYHYYVTELAFYWSLMFSQFTDIKRKVRRTTVRDSVCEHQLPLPEKHFIIHLLFLIRRWQRLEVVCVCVRFIADASHLQLHALSPALTFVIILESHMVTLVCYLEKGGSEARCCTVCECFGFSARGRPVSCESRTERA